MENSAQTDATSDKLAGLPKAVIVEFLIVLFIGIVGIVEYFLNANKVSLGNPTLAPTPTNTPTNTPTSTPIPHTPTSVPPTNMPAR